MSHDEAMDEALSLQREANERLKGIGDQLQLQTTLLTRIATLMEIQTGHVEM